MERSTSTCMHTHRCVSTHMHVWTRRQLHKHVHTCVHIHVCVPAPPALLSTTTSRFRPAFGTRDTNPGELWVSGFGQRSAHTVPILLVMAAFTVVARSQEGQPNPHQACIAPLSPPDLSPGTLALQQPRLASEAHLRLATPNAEFRHGLVTPAINEGPGERLFELTT